jgi:hypothetical protein
MALYSWPVAILIVENLEIRSGAPVFLRIHLSVEKVLAFNLEDIRLKPTGLIERGRPTYADLGRTRYGCRTFQVD